MQVFVNGTAFDAPEGGTLAALVQIIAPRGRYAIELNGEIVPRSGYAESVLAPGDRVEVVQAVGGG